LYAKFCPHAKSCPYKRLWPIEEEQAINLSNIIHLLFIVLLFYRSLYHALAALGLVDLCRFVLKSGRFSSMKARGICYFAQKASVHYHESTTTILVLRDSFACQHNWRLRWGQSIERSPAHPAT
jgi:hypothetical protein